MERFTEKSMRTQIASLVGCGVLAACTGIPTERQSANDIVPAPAVEAAIAGDLHCPANPDYAKVATSLHMTEATLRTILANRNMSLQAYCDAPFRRKLNTLVRGRTPPGALAANPQAASDFEYRLSRLEGFDPTGQIDVAAEYAAAAQQALQQRLAQVRSRGDVALPKATDNAVWTSLGPGSSGGRLRSLLIDPTNPNIVWLGAVSGGVWKSTDAGQTWRATTDSTVGSVGIYSMTMMPGNPNTVFATTGEVLPSVGIIVTRDGGNTWQTLSATGDAAAALQKARALVIHPLQTSLMVIAAGNAGIWRTTDGGATWTQAAPAIPITATGTTFTFPSNTNSLKMDPNTPSNLIATTSYGAIQTSNDFGATWQTSTQYPGNTEDARRRIEVAYAKSAPGRVYAAAGPPLNDANKFTEILRSDNGGATWVSLGRAKEASRPFNTWRDQSNYDLIIWADPTNANHLLVGDIGMWRSSDAGNTWNLISDYATRPFASLNIPYSVNTFGAIGSAEYLHPDHHAIVEDPGYNGTSNRRIWFGNDGGVWKADDITLLRFDTTPSPTDTGTRTGPLAYLNTDLRITQSYYVNGAADLGGFLISGTQDNGSRYYNGNAINWWQSAVGDGFRGAVNPNNPTLFINTGQASAIQRVSTNPARPRLEALWSGFSGEGFSFATYVEASKLAPNRLYMMGSTLWVSDDIWSPSPTRTRILGEDTQQDGNIIAATAVAPSNPNTVWVIRQQNGVLHKTNNALSSAPGWQRVVVPATQASMGTRVYIDPTDENRVYATFSIGVGKAVLRSKDGGSTWQDLTNNLPNSYVYAITQHPLNRQVIYVGTEFGLFVSNDDGATWSLMSGAPTGVPIEDLQWFDNQTLLVATFGRGVYKVANPSALAAPGQTQTITFANPGLKALSQSGFTPPASATSGLPVSFWSATPGVCTVAGGVVKLWTGGTCTLNAMQPGNAAYFSAPPVQQSFNVSAPAATTLSKRAIDVDGQGRSAIVMRNSAGQMMIGRFAAGASLAFTPFAGPDTSYRLVAVVDLDGNGKSDLVFQNMTQGTFGDVKIWPDFQSSNERLWRQVKQVWDVQAVGDLDGDGKGDLVWRYVADDPRDTGVSYIWFYDDANVPVVRKRGGAPLDWQLLGAADLNNDGAADMIYINPQGQIRALMATNNPVRTCANLLVGNMPTGYTALKVGDFTGGRRGDILMRNNATGKVVFMMMNATGLPLPPSIADPNDPNASCTGTSFIIDTNIVDGPQVPATYTYFASGDYDGDGILDTAWLSPAGIILYLSRQPESAFFTNVVPPAGYTVFQP